MPKLLLLFLLLPLLSINNAVQIRRFDMLALTDFQQASHRLQRTSSRQISLNQSHPGDQFGSSLASLGDIDQDGHSEFAVTSFNPNASQIILNFIRITPTTDIQLLATHPAFSYPQRTCITSLTLIGHQVSPNPLTSFAVGAPLHAPAGAVFITVIDKNARPINEPTIVRPTLSTQNARFGASVAYLGDINSDGHNDLMIGAPGQSTLYVAFLDGLSNVKSLNSIYVSRPRRDAFGSSMASIGDINDDGRMELIVASGKHVFLLFLKPTAEIARKIQLDLPGIATRSLARSSVLSFVGLDDAENVIFAIGNRYDNDGGAEKGSIWVATMNTTGSILRCVKFSDTQGNVDGELQKGDHFGASLATALDVNRDGSAELLVGVPRPPSTLSHLIKRGGRALKDRPGQLWILDVPGTRSVRVTKLEEMSPSFGCVFSRSSCTCSFRQQQKARCLTIARTTDDEGLLCRERVCSSSFECGKY